MAKKKKINLSNENAFLLYRAIATEALIKIGFSSDAWDFTSSLDMSFEEAAEKPVNLWPALAMCDALQFKSSCPEYFAGRETIH